MNDGPMHLDYCARRFETDETDSGLRIYMRKVYTFMASGLAISGVSSHVGVGTGFYQQIAGTPLIWVVMLARSSLQFS